MSLPYVGGRTATSNKKGEVLTVSQQMTHIEDDDSNNDHIIMIDGVAPFSGTNDGFFVINNNYKYEK